VDFFDNEYSAEDIQESWQEYKRTMKN